jgi:hypothetical protein
VDILVLPVAVVLQGFHIGLFANRSGLVVGSLFDAAMTKVPTNVQQKLSRQSWKCGHGGGCRTSRVYWKLT